MERLASVTTTTTTVKVAKFKFQCFGDMLEFLINRGVWDKTWVKDLKLGLTRKVELHERKVRNGKHKRNGYVVVHCRTADDGSLVPSFGTWADSCWLAFEDGTKYDNGEKIYYNWSLRELFEDGANKVTQSLTAKYWDFNIDDFVGIETKEETKTTIGRGWGSY